MKSSLRQRWDSRIKLRHLRIALIVSEKKSMARASEALHVTAPAVSKAISEIEEVIGAALFERRGRTFRETEAGTEFIASAYRVIREIDNLGDELNFLLDGGGRRLSIGMAAVYGQHFIAAALAQTRQTHGHFRSKLIDAPYSELLAGIRTGEFDLGFGRIDESILGTDFETLAIAKANIVVIASPGHPALDGPVTWEDAMQMTWCLPQYDAPLRQNLRQVLLRNGFSEPPDLIETSSIHLGLKIVPLIPILAMSIRGPDLALIDTCEVVPSLSRSFGQSTIGLIWSRTAPLSRSARNFVDTANGLIGRCR